MANDGAATGSATRCPTCQSDLTTVERRHHNVIDGSCGRCGAKWTQVLDDWEWRLLRLKEPRSILLIMPERRSDEPTRNALRLLREHTTALAHMTRSLDAATSIHIQGILHAARAGATVPQLAEAAGLSPDEIEHVLAGT
jgi:hypothetical protein